MQLSGSTPDCVPLIAWHEHVVVAGMYDHTRGLFTGNVLSVLSCQRHNGKLRGLHQTSSHDIAHGIVHGYTARLNGTTLS